MVKGWAQSRSAAICFRSTIQCAGRTSVYQASAEARLHGPQPEADVQLRAHCGRYSISGRRSEPDMPHLSTQLDRLDRC